MTQVNDVLYDEAAALIRGESGSSVTLSILREVSNEKVLLDFTVLREDLILEAVEGRVSASDRSVGIVSITTFDLTTPEGLKKSMDTLLESGVTRFVIDLRNNGGGDLESVIACAGLFLQKNQTILSTEDKNGKKTVYTARERIHNDEYAPCSLHEAEIGKYRGYSYAILINRNTASAAELLTSVFRDYSLGTIVGERSFGKGLMQGVYSLAPLGLEGGIRVTTKRYFPPCGEGYNGIGIEPDIAVEFPADKTPGTIEEADDPQLMRAIEMLRSK
jgi:carboxyl-terminal processing protease